MTSSNEDAEIETEIPHAAMERAFHHHKKEGTIKPWMWVVGFLVIGFVIFNTIIAGINHMQADRQRKELGCAIAYFYPKGNPYGDALRKQFGPCPPGFPLLGTTVTVAPTPHNSVSPTVSPTVSASPSNHAQGTAFPPGHSQGNNNPSSQTSSFSASVTGAKATPTPTPVSAPTSSPTAISAPSATHVVILPAPVCGVLTLTLNPVC